MIKDTAVIVYKNGKGVTYPNITKAMCAVREDGLDIDDKTIKIRCSRGTPEKNGYKFRWANPQQHLGKKNKKKGNGFELEICDMLQEIGYNAVTSRSESKLADANKIDIIDLDGELPLAIQAKYLKVTPNFFKIKSECKTDKPFCIIWKKTAEEGSISPGKIAMVDLDFFMKLLKLYKHEMDGNKGDI
jgi:hypothetical protein